MIIDTATYSRSAILDCVKTLKEYRFSASELSSVEGLQDLERLHNYLFSKTDCLLFNPDWDFYLTDFRYAVFYGMTKADQRKALRHVESYLKNQIADIWAMMQAGEVNTIE